MQMKCLGYILVWNTSKDTGKQFKKRFWDSSEMFRCLHQIYHSVRRAVFWVVSTCGAKYNSYIFIGLLVAIFMWS
jgi:hypothetical protein